MKILQVTPGTGNFYCGVCVRDNALADALRRMDHEVHLIPLYLPMVTEGIDASDNSPILFGGINVYLQQKSALFRKTPRWVDQWFDSKSLLMRAAAKAGMTRAKDLGEITVSTLRGAEGQQEKEALRLVEWLKQYGQPDVICLATSLLAGLAPPLRKALDAPVVCTFQGEDSYLDSLPQPYRDESWNLLAQHAQAMDANIVVSRYYGNILRDRLGLRDNLHVVPNGISLDGFSGREWTPNEGPILGYFARLCRDKGLGAIVETFVRLKKRGKVEGLRLKLGGTSTPADQPYIEQQRRRLADAGLEDHAEIRENLTREEKIGFLESLSVLSVPATYGESFGLYVIEAWAAGAPVVQPDSGGFTELLEEVDGGILTAGAGPDELAEAIEEVLLHPEKAKRFSENGKTAVEQRFNVDRMARDVLKIFEIAGESLSDHGV